MESSAIGVGTLDNGFFGYYGPISCDTQNQRMLPATSPLKDRSLFGNDSDDSDIDELELMSRVLNFLPKETAVGESGKGKEPRSLCYLSGEELLYEGNGEVAFFCLRACKDSDPVILTKIAKSSKEEIRKIRVQENDLVVMMAGRICEEEILEVVKRLIKGKAGRNVLPREFLKEATEELESRSKEVLILIVAKISKAI